MSIERLEREIKEIKERLTRLENPPCQLASVIEEHERSIIDEYINR